MAALKLQRFNMDGWQQRVLTCDRAEVRFQGLKKRDSQRGSRGEDIFNVDPLRGIVAGVAGDAESIRLLPSG